jgi:hypothetical protein
MIYTLTDSIVPVSNVKVMLRDAKGAVVDYRESHNVFTNGGRRWLRNHLARVAYPSDTGGEINCADGTEVDNYSIVTSGSGSPRSYWPRWIGVGVGGVGQTVSPPGPGTTIEVVTVERLERPVLVTTIPSTQYLKQVLPQNDLSDTDAFPSDYAIRYRAIFGPDDISFADQPDYTYAVPVSEVGLFTSEASISDDPESADGDTAKVGLIAYNTFNTLTKTPKFSLEIVWELRV